MASPLDGSHSPRHQITPPEKNTSVTHMKSHLFVAIVGIISRYTQPSSCAKTHTLRSASQSHLSQSWQQQARSAKRKEASSMWRWFSSGEGCLVVEVERCASVAAAALHVGATLLQAHHHPFTLHLRTQNRALLPSGSATQHSRKPSSRAASRP